MLSQGPVGTAVVRDAWTLSHKRKGNRLNFLYSFGMLLQKIAESSPRLVGGEVTLPHAGEDLHRVAQIEVQLNEELLRLV